MKGSSGASGRVDGCRVWQLARRSRVLGAGVLAVALLVTAGCGLGERADLEQHITGAPARAEGRTVSGAITVESRFVEGPAAGAGGIGVPAGAEDFEIPEGGFAFGSEAVHFTMDLATSRAALSRSAGEAPFVYIDDLVLYGRRRGVPDDDARPWVRLDLDDLNAGSGELDPFGENTVQAITALHPAVVTDLVGGSLTGSIETREQEQVAGVAATRYEVNVSIDKALSNTRRSRYPEKRREIVEELIELLGIDGDLHAAEIWIDDDGLLRRFSVALVQRPAPRIKFALVVTVDYETYDGTFTDALPSPQEVLTVDTVLRFIGVVGAAPTDEESGDVPGAPAEDTP